MSLNWGRRDVAERLKQTRVAITDVRVGDLVVETEHGIPWGVAKVETCDDGTASLLNEANNGTSQPADVD